MVFIFVRISQFKNISNINTKYWKKKQRDLYVYLIYRINSSCKFFLIHNVYIVHKKDKNKWRIILLLHAWCNSFLCIASIFGRQKKKLHKYIFVYCINFWSSKKWHKYKCILFLSILISLIVKPIRKPVKNNCILFRTKIVCVWKPYELEHSHTSSLPTGRKKNPFFLQFFNKFNKLSTLMDMCLHMIATPKSQLKKKKLP